MSDFKFNFSKFGKPKVKTSRDLPRREVIQQNIIGVIGINLDATYYVDINGQKYTLTLESYDLKGKNVYYARVLQKNKTLEIIKLTKQVRNNKQYLPFAVGSIVKGSIYKILGMERFNIKKVLELKEVPEDTINYFKTQTIKHKRFFKDNYEEILQCMI